MLFFHIQWKAPLSLYISPRCLSPGPQTWQIDLEALMKRNRAKHAPVAECFI